MKALKIAICDDETLILDEVSSYIKKYSEKSGNAELEVFLFSTAKELINSIDNGEVFDIFLLDVYIGDEMGTDLARKIRANGIESPIVFLTTSIEHAPESMETDTLRYLIKPLKPEKFYEAMDVALEKATKLCTKYIMLKTENGVENINVGNILYTESRSHYQYVNFVNGEQVRSRMTVSSINGETLIIASYGDDSMIDCKAYSDLKGNVQIRVADVINTSGATRLKVFLWKSLKTLAPACDCAEEEL